MKKQNIVLFICLIFVLILTSCFGEEKEVEVITSTSIDVSNIGSKGITIENVGPDTTIEISGIDLEKGISMQVESSGKSLTKKQDDKKNNKNVYKTDGKDYLLVPDDEGTSTVKGNNIGISGIDIVLVNKFNNIDNDFEIARSESKYTNTVGIVGEYYYVKYGDYKTIKDGTETKLDKNKPMAVVRYNSMGCSDFFAIIQSGFDPSTSYGLLEFQKYGGFGIYMGDVIPQKNWGDQYKSSLRVVNTLELNTGNSTSVTVKDDIAVIYVNVEDDNSSTQNYNIVATFTGSTWDETVANALAYYSIRPRYKDGTNRTPMIPIYDEVNNKVVFQAGTINEDFIFTVDLTALDSYFDPLTNPITFTLEETETAPVFVDLGTILDTSTYDVIASNTAYTTVGFQFSKTVNLISNSIGATVCALYQVDSINGYSNYLMYQTAKGFYGYAIIKNDENQPGSTLFTFEKTDNKPLTGHSRLTFLNEESAYYYTCADEECPDHGFPVLDFSNIDKYATSSFAGNYVSKDSYGDENDDKFFYGKLVYNNLGFLSTSNPITFDISSSGNAIDKRFSSFLGRSDVADDEYYKYDIGFAISDYYFDENGWCTHVVGDLTYYDPTITIDKYHTDRMVTVENVTLTCVHDHIWERDDSGTVPTLVCSGLKACDKKVTNFVEMTTATSLDITVKITGLNEGDYISFYNSTEKRNEGDLPNVPSYTFEDVKPGLDMWLIPSSSNCKLTMKGGPTNYTLTATYTGN